MKFDMGSEYDDNDAELTYIPEEYSILGTYCDPGLGFVSILVNDLELGMDENGWIIGVYGYCPIVPPFRKTDNYPQDWERRRLKVVAGEHWMEGDARRINDELWPVTINATKGWICIGDQSLFAGDQQIEFFPNAVATFRSGSLVATWLKPKNLLKTINCFS